MKKYAIFILFMIFSNFILCMEKSDLGDAMEIDEIAQLDKIPAIQDITNQNSSTTIDILPPEVIIMILEYFATQDLHNISDVIENIKARFNNKNFSILRLVCKRWKNLIPYVSRSLLKNLPPYSTGRSAYQALFLRTYNSVENSNSIPEENIKGKQKKELLNSILNLSKTTEVYVGNDGINHYVNVLTDPYSPAEALDSVNLFTYVIRNNNIVFFDKLLHIVKAMDPKIQVKILNNNSNLNALECAANNRSIKIFEKLLEYLKSFDEDTQLEFLNKKNKANQNILLSTSFTCPTATMLLLKHIENWSETNKVKLISDKTPEGLHLLINVLELGHFEVFNTLLKIVEEFSQQTKLAIIGSIGYENKTPLMFSIFNRRKTCSANENKGMVEQLLNQIKSWNKQDQFIVLDAKNSFGNNALVCAIHMDDKVMFETLLNHINEVFITPEDQSCKKILLNSVNNQGNNLLMEAVLYDKIEMALLLVNNIKKLTINQRYEILQTRNTFNETIYDILANSRMAEKEILNYQLNQIMPSNQIQ